MRLLLPLKINMGIQKSHLFVEGELADTTELMNYLKSKIPNYMVPSQVLLIEKIPIKCQWENRPK